MIQQLYDDYIFIYGMAGLCVLGTMLKIMVSRTYKRLIKASDNMGSTKHKLMKLMKMKFEACYKLKIGVNNVDSFVDKYVYKHKICGIHLYTWENIGGQLLILCLLAGTVGSVLGLVYNCGKNDILITFFSGVFTSSLLIVVESFINLGAKKSILKANITDYLENFLKVRLEQENFTPEVLEEYRQEYFSSAKKSDGKKDKKKETKGVESSSIVEDKYTRNRRIVEELKAEEQALKLDKEKEREKKRQFEKEQRSSADLKNQSVAGEREISKKERNKEMLLREKELNAKQIKAQQVREIPAEEKPNKAVDEVQKNLQPIHTVKEDEVESMRFLIKNLADTAASQEGAHEEEEQIMPKEKVDTKKDNQRVSRTESEEKIIEDILKEFLA
ncbi:hypothetical protein [Anaerosporobacter sp.]|uniref:hypothetical protein n=1 Tax=Anaerosporobacter sp. TaxID=1872529 RepID=UPI0028A0129B|nr:hypothetical protein [Anaerosporobacter sp.]